MADIKRQDVLRVAGHYLRRKGRIVCTMRFFLPHSYAQCNLIPRGGTVQTLQPTAHPGCVDCHRLLDAYALSIQALVNERLRGRGGQNMDKLALAVVHAEIALHEHEAAA